MSIELIFATVAVLCLAVSAWLSHGSRRRDRVSKDRYDAAIGGRMQAIAYLMEAQQLRSRALVRVTQLSGRPMVSASGTHVVGLDFTPVRIDIHALEAGADPIAVICSPDAMCIAVELLDPDSAPELDRPTRNDGEAKSDGNSRSGESEQALSPV